MNGEKRPTLIYLIAGEPSGDLLGARLMESLRTKVSGPVMFAGIGGPRMEEQGLHSLFPYRELSLMGFTEIVPHIPRLLAHMGDTFADIRARQPAAIVTIDSPGFNFRLAEKLLKSSVTRDIPRIHYVAPSVWAYKPKRALKAARLFNHMLLLLPFEAPYFEQAGLPCTYVGHPVLWEWREKGDGADFRRRHHIPDRAPVVSLLPGSRRGEVLRLLPVYEATLALLRKRQPNLHAVMVAGTQVAELVSTHARPGGLPILVVGEHEKKDAFAASGAALSKSGTVTLELAMAGVPMVVTYKVSAYSAWILRRMLQISYYSLVNIVENREIIPEMMQEKCRPELLAQHLGELIHDTEARRVQLNDMRQALTHLGADQAESPSDLAAKAVLSLIHP